MTELEAQVRFGFVLTGADIDFFSNCPDMVTVEPELNNRAAIESRYPASVVTTDAVVYYGLKHVLERVRIIENDAERRGHGVVLFLPQKGESMCSSDLIENGGLFEGATEVPKEQDDRLVGELSDLGVRTFILSSDNDDLEFSIRERLERIAELGDSGHGPFLVGDGDELGDALREITSSLVSCQVTLEGEVVEGRECSGEVTIDGEPIPCDDPNGWQLTGPSSLEFVGAACEGLQQKADAQIRARFPCDVIII